MASRVQPQPRTDSGWSWADFWNWFAVQPADIQQWTMQENELMQIIQTMAPDVQNEALYNAPETVQAAFDNSERASLLAQARDILRRL